MGGGQFTSEGLKFTFGQDLMNVNTFAILKVLFIQTDTHDIIYLPDTKNTTY